MNDRPAQHLSVPQHYFHFTDWAPDIRRFEREVLEAEMRGVGDGLSLAEMECSLDLIDAELAGFRSARHGDFPHEHADRLSQLRDRLASLIERMQPLATY